MLIVDGTRVPTRDGASLWLVDTLILGLLDPEEARTPSMVMKDYSDEFKADVVALYESTLGGGIQEHRR